MDQGHLVSFMLPKDNQNIMAQPKSVWVARVGKGKWEPWQVMQVQLPYTIELAEISF